MSQFHLMSCSGVHILKNTKCEFRHENTNSPIRAYNIYTKAVPGVLSKSCDSYDNQGKIFLTPKK